MNTDFAKEKVAMEKLWSKREQQIKKIVLVRLGCMEICRDSWRIFAGDKES